MEFQVNLQVQYALHYNPRFVYFLPAFWSPKTFFQGVFFWKISAFIYGKDLRAVSNQEWVMMGDVRKVNWILQKILLSFSNFCQFRSCSWILILHKAIILIKKSPEKTFLDFKKRVKVIPTAGYNGAQTVLNMDSFTYTYIRYIHTYFSLTWTSEIIQFVLK